MTPMQKLKSQFDLLKSKLPKWKEVALNKSEPKNSVSFFCGIKDEHETKGVKSDFIKSFQLKLNNDNFHSLGFSFNYLDKPESEWNVSISLKKGLAEPSFLYSEKLNIDDCRIKLNQLNEKLDNLNLDSSIQIFIDVFDLKMKNEKKTKIRKNKIS